MDKVYEDAVKHFGICEQYDQAIEELAELIVAIRHYKRGRISLHDIASEVADVEIMCSQLRCIIGDEIVQDEKDMKLKRLAGILS
jgi:predicted HTH domain antitoxin